MIPMIGKFRRPALAMFFALFLCIFVTSPATAAMVSSQSSAEQAGGADLRSQEIDKIKLVLENKIVQEKLRAYGFTAEEIKSKLQGMTEGQIHLLAQASDNVIAGGDSGLGWVIGVLIIILLVILILKLLDKKIVIQ